MENYCEKSENHIRLAGQSKQIATNAAAKTHLICIQERITDEGGKAREMGENPSVQMPAKLSFALISA